MNAAAEIGRNPVSKVRFKRPNFCFQISKQLAPKIWNLTCSLSKDVTWASKWNLVRALQLYCCTTGNDGNTKQECVYEHKPGYPQNSLDSSIFSLTVFFSLLTWIVLVPLKDRSKHLGQFVERVFIHTIHFSKAEPEGAPRFLRSAMAQPISRLPLLLSATCGTAYDALMCCPCVPMLQRFGKGSKTWKLTAPNFWAPSSFQNFGNDLEERLLSNSTFSGICAPKRSSTISKTLEATGDPKNWSR